MRVLFVCMGNICRSPTAEAVFRELLQREAPELGVEVDSAGLHDFHRGEPPDRRAIQAARRRGFDLSALRARPLAPADFDGFNLILVMDHENHREVLSRAPPRCQPRIRLLLDYAPEQAVREVPDPYYGDATGFERVLDLVESACRGLLKSLRKRRPHG